MQKIVSYVRCASYASCTCVIAVLATIAIVLGICALNANFAYAADAPSALGSTELPHYQRTSSPTSQYNSHQPNQSALQTKLLTSQPTFRPAQASEPLGPPLPTPQNKIKRIFVLDAPFLTWSDISESTTPNLYAILDTSGVGNAIARSTARASGDVVSPDEAAASIDAGYWVSDPTIESCEPFGSTGAEKITLSDGYLPGTLGSLLCANNWTTVALGCSDLPGAVVRPAFTLLSNKQGVVLHALTNPAELLASSNSAAYGTSTNTEALISFLDAALEQTSKSNAVVGIDSGDLYRAGTLKILNNNEASYWMWRNAVLSFDEVVGATLERMGTNDVLIVYSPLAHTSNANHTDDGYGPLIIHGAGYDGVLGSSGTNKSDLVSILDITSTILNFANINFNVEGAGVITCSKADKPAASLISELNSQSTLAHAIAEGQPLMIALMGILLLLSFAFSVLMLSTKLKLPSKALGKCITITRLLWILAAAFPIATYIMIPFCPSNVSVEGAVAICIIITIVLAIAATVVGYCTRWLYSPIFLMALTVVVLLCDQLLGAHMAHVGFLSYNPIHMGRFSGIGNEGAAVLFASWLMLSGLMLNRFPSLKISKMFRTWMFHIASALIMMVIIAPWWGANFGVLVWGTIGVCAAWWYFLGKRLSWKMVLGAVVVCIGLVVVLVLADGLLGEQSHLGTTASLLTSQGLSYVPTIVYNMVRLSAATIFYSPALSVVLIFAWLYLAYIRIKKPGPYQIFWQRNQYFKAAFTASMIVAVVMLFVEDSGIVLPALVLVYSTAGLTWMVCDLHRWEQRAVELGPEVAEKEFGRPIGGFKIDLRRIRPKRRP